MVTKHGGFFFFRTLLPLVQGGCVSRWASGWARSGQEGKWAGG